MGKLLYSEVRDNGNCDCVHEDTSQLQNTLTENVPCPCPKTGMVSNNGTRQRMDRQYINADGRVQSARTLIPDDGLDPNAPKMVRFRACAVPQGITMDNIGYKKYPTVMATIDGRGIVPSDNDYVGPVNAPGSNYPCYRFASGPLSAPGWQFRLDYIVTGWQLNSLSPDLPGTQSLITVNPSDCCTNPIQLYGCTDPQATNYNPQSQLDDGTCTYSPRPTPTNDAEIMARKGRGLSDQRMNRYKQFNG